jgi:hypothetical protein
MPTKCDLKASPTHFLPATFFGVIVHSKHSQVSPRAPVVGAPSSSMEDHVATHLFIFARRRPPSSSARVNSVSMRQRSRAARLQMNVRETCTAPNHPQMHPQFIGGGAGLCAGLRGYYTGQRGPGASNQSLHGRQGCTYEVYTALGSKGTPRSGAPGRSCCTDIHTLRRTAFISA